MGNFEKALHCLGKTARQEQACETHQSPGITCRAFYCAGVNLEDIDVGVYRHEIIQIFDMIVNQTDAAG